MKSPARELVRLFQATALFLCFSLPGTAGELRPAKLAEIDAAVNLAIADGKLPGGVLWIESRGATYRKTYGNKVSVPVVDAATEDTIYDAASLTKVIATTTAIMKLREQGKLELDATVALYIPEFTGAGKEAITVRQLLTHTSGLRPGISSRGDWNEGGEAIRRASAEPLPDPPGTKFRYSDINFILLGELVHRTSGQTLDVYCAEQIFGPLKMADTGFLPPAERRGRIAPTLVELRGEVHDPTARRMGGVAGHAGLFTTASDLARFARMLLNMGELEGVRVLQPETVRLMTSVQTPPHISALRGLGWDIDSPFAGPRGDWFPVGGYGHTGWTGGSLWVDPFSRSFVVFLSNRNHPSEAGNVVPLRRVIGTLAAEAIGDFNFVGVPGALPRNSATPSMAVKSQVLASEVLSGLDVLVEDKFKPLQGLRVGLVTNHTGIDRQRRSAIDLLHKAPQVKLVALFSPEHGIRGALDEKVGDARDEKTGLPIYSLYGESRTPTAAQLEGLDALVFDIQDIGCRFYTYISTLGECLTAAGKHGKKIIVLDRPNPIGGAIVEGPVLAAERSFVMWHEIPLRHGMTVGELAKMFNEERKLGADLTVIPCANWSREQWFDRTSLPWINPSPNMRSLTQATLYPGVGLVEFCNVSVGRGTDRPFEYLGAPYIDGARLAAELNAAGLAGVTFVQVRYTPKTSVFANRECNGVELIVTDRLSLNSPELGITLAAVLHRLYPADLNLDKMARLLGHPATLEAIRAGQPLSGIRSLWVADRQAFAERRAPFLIYDYQADTDLGVASRPSR